MIFPQPRLSDWFWAAGPFKRFLASLVVTAAIVLIPYLAGYPTPNSLIALFLGWDLGAWFMDKAYAYRLSQRTPMAG